MIPTSTPASNLYDSYEFRAISKQVNRAIKGSNSPLSPYSYYLKSASPAAFYSKLRLRRICGTTNTKKTQDSPRAKGFVWRLWTKIDFPTVGDTLFPEGHILYPRYEYDPYLNDDHVANLNINHK
ncbi:hypothetical protein L6452_34272 [Arctium lappa]|uniref:Uncharacterized protein n=1 Tax=Arctium lappa TaxID=4217 RepID=A0ACB8YHW5_ARCLA|nr:hypothetical protein L6452_34272 [Arctium lappa]